MRILCTGSREWNDEQSILDELDALAARYLAFGQPRREIVTVHGACPKGADALVDKAARELGYTVEAHPAQWEVPGLKGIQRNAGFMRNSKMVELGADLCIAFWDGESRGTLHCFTEAVKAGIPVRIVPERKR